MMKKIFITVITLALCGGGVFSQGHLDAYKYGQTGMNGTARYLGMGGAFGALGGDVSAMKDNPAGLAVYKSSEVVTTLSLNTTKAKTDWLGTVEEKNKTHLNVDNIAYVGYFPTGNDYGIVNWNVGFAYNRLKNYNRSYTMSTGSHVYSIADYMAERAYGNPSADLLESSGNTPYDYVSDWLSVLSYNAGIIADFNDNDKEYYNVFGDYNDKDEWYLYDVTGNYLEVHESGAVDQYDFSFGLNVSDIVLLGATVAVTDISYNQEIKYDEYFEYENNDLFLDNGLSVDGTGYSFNAGVIVRPVDFLRFGVAYNSPTWYNMTDFYYGKAASAVNFYNENGELEQLNKEANTPSQAYTEYKYRSPDKWLFSAAAIIGNYALLSVDYELTNYRNMNMKDRDGRENQYTNSDIYTDFGSGQTIRIGGEFKPTPRFAVRAGGGWSKTPMKTHLLNGETEVHTVGTITNFTLDRGSSYYSVGLGYRFTPNFYTDVAYVYTSHKEDVYAFSDMFYGEGSNRTQLIDAQSANMKTNDSRLVLTLGYKF